MLRTTYWAVELCSVLAGGVLLGASAIASTKAWMAGLFVAPRRAEVKICRAGHPSNGVDRRGASAAGTRELWQQRHREVRVDEPQVDLQVCGRVADVRLAASLAACCGCPPPRGRAGRLHDEGSPRQFTQGTLWPVGGCDQEQLIGEQIDSFGVRQVGQRVPGLLLGDDEVVVARDHRGQRELRLELGHLDTEVVVP